MEIELVEGRAFRALEIRCRPSAAMPLPATTISPPFSPPFSPPSPRLQQHFILNEPNPRPTALVYLGFLSALCASASAVFGKIGLGGIDADLATLIRTLVMAIFLPLLILATGKLSSPFALSQQTWLFIVLSGLASGLSSFCFFRALKQGDASLVVPVDRLRRLWKTEPIHAKIPM